MKRSFDSIWNNFKELPTRYDWFLDFDKIIKNKNVFNKDLIKLERLITSNDIEKDFYNMLKEDKTLISLIPVLIGFREKEVLTEDGKISFNINEEDINKFVTFLSNTGFFKFIKTSELKSIDSFILGLEAGLNTNARKNRSGKMMELFVRDILEENSLDYWEQKNEDWLVEKFDIKINLKNQKRKKLDFIVKHKKNIYLIETNYFKSKGGGSKINSETARFIELQDRLKSEYPSNFHFIWITDGPGLKTIKKDFTDAYNNIDNIYTIKDLQDKNLPFQK